MPCRRLRPWLAELMAVRPGRSNGLRTISAKYPKGQEPPRRLADNLRLIWYIIRTGFDYLVVGHPIRKAWYARQRAYEKYYVDEAAPVATAERTTATQQPADVVSGGRGGEP